MPACQPFLRSLVVALALAWLGACSPALNWRDVRPDGSGLLLQMPCKPDLQTRPLLLAGRPVQLSLLACPADGLTFGLSHADVGEPAQVDAALRALADAATANLGAAPAAVRPLPVAGASAPGSRLRLQGRVPDGATVQMHLVLFARDTRVFQASVLGAQVPEEAAQTYFESLRLAP